MKRSTPYVDENGLPIWAPRVSKRSIAELYHTDARGIRDADLINGVGIALLLRCESILTVAAAIDGQYECPACLATWEQPSGNREVLECTACEWTITWEQFRGTLKELSAESAVAKAFYEEFVKKFPRANQPGHKMIHIDTLIHKFHTEIGKDGPPIYPAAGNLIQGGMEEVIVFLNHLTYDKNSMPETRQTLSNWHDKTDEYRAYRAGLVPRSLFHILLIHPSQPRLLLMQEEDRWLLPRVESDDRFIGFRNMDSVTQEIRRALGGEVSGLECLSLVKDGVEHWELVYHFEHRGGEPITTDGRWCDRDDLSHLIFAVPEHRALAERCLEEVEGVADPDLRSPWNCPGWADQAEAWFEQQLNELGHRLLQPIRSTYRHGLSNILHAETSVGEIYMKASSFLPMLVDEPRLTCHLSSVFPDLVPMPIRVNTERKWMLLPDLGYPIREATEEMKIEALLEFGRLQQQAVEHVDKLLHLGCPDRRLDKLDAGIEAITHLDETTAGLSEEELAGVRRAMPQLKRMARDLAGYNLPDTLGHGDLHLGNVARQDGAYVFFDWGQGRVTHPFLDACDFIQESEMQSIAEEEYLALWTEYESRERLREALALTKPLCHLYMAIDRCYFNLNFRLPEIWITNHLRTILSLVEEK